MIENFIRIMIKSVIKNVFLILSVETHTSAIACLSHPDLNVSFLLLMNNVKSILFSISNSRLFLSKNVLIIQSNSVL